MSRNPRTRRRTMWPGADNMLEVQHAERAWAVQESPYADIKEIHETWAWSILKGFAEMDLTARMVIPDGATEFPAGFDFQKSGFNFFVELLRGESRTPLDYITWLGQWLKSISSERYKAIPLRGKPNDPGMLRLFVQHYYGYAVLSFYSLKNRTYDMQLEAALKRFWIFCRLYGVLDESLYQELPIHEKLTQKWKGDVNEYLWHKQSKVGKAEMLKQLNSIEKGARGPWNRCKLMVVGQGRAGKSATIRNLLGKEFDEGLESTVGAELTQTTTLVGSASSSSGKARRWAEESGIPYTGIHIAQIAAAKVRPLGMHQGLSRASRAPSNKNEDARQGAFRGLSRIAHKAYQGDSDEDSDDSLSSEDQERREGAQKRNLEVEKEARRGHNLRKNNNDDSEASQQSMEVIRKFGPDLIDPSGRGLLSFTIWDYGGQEVFFSLHNLFLSSQGIYLIVFDMRNILEDAKSQSSLLFWLNSVKLHAPEAPMFLVGTFLDQVDLNRIFQINSYLQELTHQFPKIVKQNGGSFFPMNNKDSQAANGLRNQVEAAALKEEYVKQLVPVKWTKWLDGIKESRNGPYARYSQILKTTAKYGIAEEELDEMLSVFHKLGALLHFTKTEALREVVVLEPQWIVTSMSKVIRDKDVHPYNMNAIRNEGLEEDMHNLLDGGLASRDLLEYLWNGSNVEFLIDLMKMTLLLSEWYVKNELTYIVPSMIRNARLETPKRHGASMVLDFTKSFLPRGVFQRLICLCIVVNPGRLVASLPLPEIHESSARIELEGEGVILIEEIGSSIVVSMLEEAPESTPQKIPQLFRVMLRKLQEEVFSDRLSWDTYYTREDSETDILEEEAVKQKLAPWFSKPIKDEQKKRTVDIVALLESTQKTSWI